MYSRSKGMTGRDFTLTPPPGYDGSRFRTRSDGRDDSFPPYRDERRHHSPNPEQESKPLESVDDNCDKDDICPDCQIEEAPPGNDTECSQNTVRSVHSECEYENNNGHSISSFLKKLGNEEILLIALIILLAGNQSNAQGDTLLILALLLCIT